jgi:hypothetical protein
MERKYVFFRKHFCEIPKKPSKYFNFFFLWTFIDNVKEKKVHYFINKM